MQHNVIRTVFIASPFSGDTHSNMAYLIEAIEHSIGTGNEAPFAPHYIYPDFLDDDDPVERIRGIGMGLAFLAKCSLLAVYADLGVSRGMALEIERAKLYGVPVEYREIR